MIPTLLAVSSLFPPSTKEVKNPVAPPVVSESQWRCANLAVWGDFLYWKGSTGELPFAVFAQVDTVLDSFQFANKESVQYVPFHFDPGFRVGIAGQFDRGWELAAKYTRFHTSAHRSKRASGSTVIIPVWDMSLPAAVDQMSAYQALQLDWINLDVIKQFGLGSHFSVAPFFGATGAWIHQQLTIKAHQVFDDMIAGEVTPKLKNNFGGAGLEVGMQTRYNPLHWLSLYGAGSYALLYGTFHLGMNAPEAVHFPGPSPTVLRIDHTQSSRLAAVVSAFDLTAGIKGTWKFSCVELSAHVDYEFALWPAQVRVPHMRSDVSNKTPTTLLDEGHGDVSFHGLTTGLKVCF